MVKQLKSKIKLNKERNNFLETNTFKNVTYILVILICVFFIYKIITRSNTQPESLVLSFPLMNIPSDVSFSESN